MQIPQLPWKKKHEEEDVVLLEQMDELAHMIDNEVPGSDRYNELMDRWLELDERRMAHKEQRHTFKIKPDTWLLVGKSVALCLLTLNYEKLDVLTSAAKNFWMHDRDRVS